MNWLNLRILIGCLIFTLSTYSCVEEQRLIITNNDRGISAKPTGKLIDSNGCEYDIVFDYDCIYDTVGNGFVNGYLKQGDNEWSVTGTRDGQYMTLNVGDFMVMALKETGYYPNRIHKFEFEGSWHTLSGMKGFVALLSDENAITDFYARNGIEIVSTLSNEVDSMNNLAEVNDNKDVEIKETLENTTSTNETSEEKASADQKDKKETSKKVENKTAQPKWGDCKLNGRIGRTNVYLDLSNGYNGTLNYGGNSTKFKVNGELNGKNLTLTEFHSDSITGVYSGNYDGFKYKGTYQRKDGKTLSFEMSVR